MRSRFAKNPVGTSGWGRSDSVEDVSGSSSELTWMMRELEGMDEDVDTEIYRDSWDVYDLEFMSVLSGKTG